MARPGIPLSTMRADSFDDYDRNMDNTFSHNYDDDEERTIRSNGNPTAGQLKPQYDGQDLRPTSRKEIWGWYSYGWAGEVFALCGMGSFIPVLLEQLARERGHLLSDPSLPCGSSTQINAGIPDQCVVNILGRTINTASFVMYTFSLSVLFQALVIISMSGAADHGHYRKKLLLGFAYVGSASCLVYVFLSPRTFWLGSLLAQIGNVCFGASFVLLNAFLPVMVRHHDGTGHEVVGANAAGEAAGLLTPINDDSDDDEFEERLDVVNAKVGKSDITSLNISTSISTKGIAIGYSGGVILQILCILLVISSKSSTFSLQLCVFFIGIWWLIFTLPSAFLLRPRPGPPLPGLANGKQKSTLQYITYAWTGLYKTIRQARKLKDVMLFLAAWFMVSDGVATIASSAMMFAKTNLHMPPASLAIIGVIMPVAGIIGAISWPKFSAYLRITASQTILICVCIFALIPLYGLLGLVSAVRDAGFGLTRPAEMYGLAIVYGFVLGGLGGYCRSVFSELIPPGSEAAFYALYAITDKGSSVFGPTIVGLITDKWGDIRLAFWFMLLLLLVPMPILYYVDVGRGKASAMEMAKEAEDERMHNAALDHDQ